MGDRLCHTILGNKNRLPLLYLKVFAMAADTTIPFPNVLLNEAVSINLSPSRYLNKSLTVTTSIVV